MPDELLSQKVMAICRHHWRADAKRMPMVDCCKACPLIKRCHVVVGHTEQDQDQWRADMNSLAEDVFDESIYKRTTQ